jgi:tetratricopeptide (TPR) repeat protein
LVRTGREAFLDGHYNRAAALYNAALAMAQELGDILNPAVAELLMGIGDLRCELFEYAAAESFYTRAVIIFARQKSSSRVDVCIAFSRLSEVCRIQGKEHEAMLFQHQSVDLLKERRATLALLLVGSSLALRH